jgi:hypothetical protein
LRFKVSLKGEKNNNINVMSEYTLLLDQGCKNLLCASTSEERGQGTCETKGRSYLGRKEMKSDIKKLAMTTMTSKEKELVPFANLVFLLSSFTMPHTNTTHCDISTTSVNNISFMRVGTFKERKKTRETAK